MIFAPSKNGRERFPDSRQRLRADQKLVGRSCIVFSAEAPTDLYPHKLAEVLIRQTRNGGIEEACSLKDGRCCRQKRCWDLLRWDSARILGFDVETGATTSWWLQIADENHNTTTSQSTTVSTEK